MLNLKSHFGVPHPSLSEKHEKNLVSISLVNCDLQVSEQQLAFLQLMKTVLCVSCSAESRERGQMTLGAASLLFPPLTDVLWGCVYGVIEGRWGRRFVRLRKCGGQQEHLIVAKPFEDKPRASFTVCKNVVDHPDTWDQSCSVPSSWVKGNKCGSTLACTCLCHREGVPPSSEEVVCSLRDYDVVCVQCWLSLWVNSQPLFMESIARFRICSLRLLKNSFGINITYLLVSKQDSQNMLICPSNTFRKSHLLPSQPIAHFCFFQPKVTLFCNQDTSLHEENPCTSQHRGISWDYNTSMPFPNCAVWVEFFGFWLDM